MKALGKIHVTVWLLGLAGAALFTILLIRQGLPQVGAAFATAGWAIAAVVAFHLAVPVFFDAVAWWVLFPKSERPALLQLLWMRWVGESVSTLVPSAAVGGDIVRGGRGIEPVDTPPEDAKRPGRARKLGADIGRRFVNVAEIVRRVRFQS